MADNRQIGALLGGQFGQSSQLGRFGQFGQGGAGGFQDQQMRAILAQLLQQGSPQSGQQPPAFSGPVNQPTVGTGRFGPQVAPQAAPQGLPQGFPQGLPGNFQGGGPDISGMIASLLRQSIGPGANLPGGFSRRF